MRKNLILISITSILLILTYLVKEKQIFAKNLLFSDSELDQISSIIFKDQYLTRDQNSWKIKKNNLSADQEKVDKLFKIFANMRIVSKDENKVQEKSVFDFVLLDSKGETKLSINHFSEITGRLRVNKNDQSYLITLNQGTDGVFQSEQALNLRLYSELANYQNQNYSFLKKNYFNQNLKEIKKVNFKRAISFGVDFEQSSTKPSVLEGLDYQKDLKGIFKNYLSALEIEKEYFDTDLKKEVLSEIGGNDKEWLTLYKTKSQNPILVVRDHLLNKEFVVKENGTQIFFLKKEHFWNLEVLSETIFSEVNKLELVLKQKDKKMVFSVPNTQKFIIEGEPGIEVNQKTLTELFKVFFSIDDYGQAYRVALNPHQPMAKDYIEVNLLNRNFKLWLSNSFIHIFDQNKKLLFSFVNSNQIIKNNTLDQFIKGSIND